MAKVQDLDVSARHCLRGVVRASITKLATHVSELERKPELSHFDQLTAKRMQERLAGLDSEFKSYHLSIITLLEEETDLDTEQATLADHDDKVSGLFNRLVMLITPVEHEAKANPHQNLIKRLQHLECNLRKVSAEISTAADNPELDRFWIEQYDEQINGFKFELFDVSRSILSLDEDTPGLAEQESRLSQLIFDTPLQRRQLLRTPAPVAYIESIKVSKIDVPRFDGDMMTGIASGNNMRYPSIQENIYRNWRNCLT